MYIGGIGPPYAIVNIPAALWTATLRQGFVGCLRDLVLSGKPIDIAAFARQQDSAAVKPSCHILPTQCTTNPCQNGGSCAEGWNRPLCDCSGTLYTGPTCGRESATLAFNGSQHLTIWIGGSLGQRTQTEELVLRFKTARPVGLLLLTNSDTNSPDRLEIALVAGRIRANVRLGDREKVKNFITLLIFVFCCECGMPGISLEFPQKKKKKTRFWKKQHLFWFICRIF